MPSRMVSGLISELSVRVLVADVTSVAQQARESHELRPGSALLLAQAFGGAAMLAALQKGNQPINLQLECDGPLRGLFVDAQSDGALRGYVKNRYVEFEGAPGPYHYRPILGNSGYMSVLRDLGGGDFYRSAVELTQFDFPSDLQAYFAQSEQALTRLHIDVQPKGNEPLGAVSGWLVQALPGAEPSSVEAVANTLRAAGNGAELDTLTSQLGWQALSTVNLAFKCRCTKERLMEALKLMGENELTQMLEEDGKAEARCQFCGKRYGATKVELEALLATWRSHPRN